MDFMFCLEGIQLKLRPIVWGKIDAQDFSKDYSSIKTVRQLFDLAATI
jgi:hypothetical protein